MQNLKLFSIAILLLFYSTILYSENNNSKKVEFKSEFESKGTHADTVFLLQGNSIDKFKFVLADKSINKKRFYKFNNGVFAVSAKVKGYFRTREKFSNCKIHSEWRWLTKDENGNSGILLFIQKPDSVWPACIQINFKEDNAGDLIAMNGAKFKEAIGKPKDTELKQNSSSEKPEGEWNECDVICIGDSMTVYVNGVFQNIATKIKTPKGFIGFQMEGKPIEFRNIYVIK